MAEWISVKDGLPEKNCNYGASVLGTDGKNIYVINYTRGFEIEVDPDCDDNGNLYDYTDGEVFMKPGWWECCEQISYTYDEVWLKRNITHWMPLPDKPAEQ